MCLECEIEFYLKEGTCVYECGINFFSDEKKICRRCEKFCKVCHFNKCILCDDDKYLLEGKICVDECPFGFVKNNNQCVKCNTLKNCKKCDEKDSRKCGECIEPEIEFMGHCINKCPDQYFQNSARCERCSVGCKICSSRNKCLFCESGYFLNNNSCVKNCDEGFIFNNNNCLECSNEDCKKCLSTNLSECELCKKGFYFYKRKCYPKCLTRTYLMMSINNHFICEDCGSNCLECIDKNYCKRCVQSTYLYNDECVSKCPEMHTSLNGKCVKCNINFCLKCDLSLKICRKCKEGYLLNKGKCYENCPQGTFIESNNCNKCPFPCRNCLKRENCIDCEDDYILYNGQCVDKCESGNIEVNRQCLECKVKNCEKCDHRLENCNRCKADLYLFRGECYRHCPDKFYVEDGMCNECKEFCLQCTTGYDCSKCQAGKVLFKNSLCLDNCPEGFINVDSKCIKCILGCKRCRKDNYNFCTSCKKPLFLYQGECLEQCPIGTYNFENKYCERNILFI